MNRLLLYRLLFATLCLGSFSIASPVYGQNLFPEVPTQILGFSGESHDFVDVDNDGDLDLVYVGEDSNSTTISKLYLNNAGVFTDAAGFASNQTFSKAVWADFDRDGDMDAFVLGAYDIPLGKVSLFTNNSGTFTEDSLLLPGLAEGDITAGDVNNDGYLDLVMQGVDQASALVSSIYVFDGSGYSLAFDTLRDVYVGASRLGDLDGDGDLDLLQAGRGPANPFFTDIYANELGSFSSTGTVLPGFGFCDAHWADFDNDGDIDFTIVGRQSNFDEGIVGLNSGGVFTQIPAQIDSLTGGSIQWGDLDNDGDLDLLANGNNSNNGPQTKVYLQTAPGVFDNVGAPFLGTTTGGASFVDYDNDGDLDVFVFGSANSTSNAKLYRNDYVTSPNTPPTAPTSVSATVNADSTITVQWSGATDAQTPAAGLSYSLWIGTTPNGMEITAPLADTATGWRRVVEYGQVVTTTWTLRGISCGNDYYFRVQAVDGGYMGSEFSAPVHVDLNTPQLQVISGGDSSGTTNTVVIQVTGVYDSLQWYENGNAIPGATSTSYTLTTYPFSNYTILAWNHFCEGRLDSLLYMVGSVDPYTRETVSVWPNPTQTVLNVRIDNPGATEAVAVYDMQGRLMREQRSAFGTQAAIAVDGLAPGLYLVKLTLKDGRGLATATFRKD